MFRLCSIWLLAALTAFPAWCAEPVAGIPLGQKFSVPFTIDGKPVRAKAVVEAGNVLRVLYVDTEGDAALLDYLLTRKGVEPQPQPQPKPDPKPNPSPLPGKVAYLYYFHESADANPTEGAVRNAKSWRDIAEKAGIVWHVWEVTEAAKAFPRSAAKAKEAGLPAVLFLDKAGASIAEKAPATQSGMDALVKKYAGVTP